MVCQTTPRHRLVLFTAHESRVIDWRTACFWCRTCCAAGCSSPPLKWGARESRTEAAAPTNKRAFETRLLRVEDMCGRMLVATANIEKRSAREKAARQDAYRHRADTPAISQADPSAALNIAFVCIIQRPWPCICLRQCIGGRFCHSSNVKTGLVSHWASVEQLVDLRLQVDESKHAMHTSYDAAPSVAPTNLACCSASRIPFLCKSNRTTCHSGM